MVVVLYENCIFECHVIITQIFLAYIHLPELGLLVAQGVHGGVRDVVGRRVHAPRPRDAMLVRVVSMVKGWITRSY